MQCTNSVAPNTSEYRVNQNCRFQELLSAPLCPWHSYLVLNILLSLMASVLVGKGNSFTPSSIFSDWIICFSSMCFRSTDTGRSYDLVNEQDRHKYIPQSRTSTWDKSCPCMHQTSSLP